MRACWAGQSGAELRGLGEAETGFGDAVAEIDCTMAAEPESGVGAIELRDSLARIRLEAEQAVRAGKTEIFLTDEYIDEDRMAISMVIAVAAVHTHLVRKGLRSYASVNVRAAECLDTHAMRC